MEMGNRVVLSHFHQTALDVRHNTSTNPTRFFGGRFAQGARSRRAPHKEKRGRRWIKNTLVFPILPFSSILFPGFTLHWQR